MAGGGDREAFQTETTGQVEDGETKPSALMVRDNNRPMQGKPPTNTAAETTARGNPEAPAERRVTAEEEASGVDKALARAGAAPPPSV